MEKIQAKLSQKRFLVAFFLVVFLLLGEVLLVSFVLARVKSISKKDQFNILILGMGGAQHEASDLTDTLIVFIANPKNRKILLVSLPRDIWIDSLKTKINSLYHYGSSELVSKEVEKIIGQPIDKVLLVDFKAFDETIDFIGGIEIKVERSFDDFYFPIPGKENDLCDGDPELACRYEYLHFEAGWQKMDGERALKFVRSRNAEGEEGTDFARNERQQKVIVALKNKILSGEILLNPQRILGFWRVAENNIQTDIAQEDYLPLLKFFFPFWRGVQLESVVLDGGAYSGEGLLYHPLNHSSGQWVLLPTGGNWEKVEEFIKEKQTN